MLRSQVWLLAAGLFAKGCVSQEAGWQAGQVNATMCYWDSPRAAVIRDSLYIDGGNLWWTPGMNDGTYGPPTNDGNPLGIVYVLNFSSPFDTTTGNITSTFTTISKAAAGSTANNIGPTYIDGTMFANYYNWITYGGQDLDTDAFQPPGANQYAEYQVYAQGPPKQFFPGFLTGDTTNGTTRYITNGAGVSVPSENLGFYFGGLRTASSGPLYNDPDAANASLRADTLSDTLIKVDMSIPGKEPWTNSSLPSSVPGRASPELVWVPVSTQGVLVAIGGVVDPSFATENKSLNAAQTLETKAQSPTFMSTVSVYDIASQQWYEQNTTGNIPGQMTQGCTVLASAQDGSSHNIYWYGGYDGISQTDNFSDDVYVLSVPSFTWTKVSNGTSTHARAGHRCSMPYPDQMFVVGGYTPLTGFVPTCLEGNIIQIFNLSSAEWITSYDPSKWSNYTVPDSVIKSIGGTSTGSATQSSPSGGFSNSSMTALFGSPYNSTKIQNFYPYHASQTTAVSRPTISPTVVTKSSGTPKFLGPVLGVILGLFFITIVILAWLLWRRRRIFKQSHGAQSEAGTMDNRRWVSSWLQRTPVEGKAPTVTTEETTPIAYGGDEARSRAASPNDMSEMSSETQRFEMMDTSPRHELSGTGFVPLSATNMASRSSRGRGIGHSPSTASHASDISEVSASQRPGISPVVRELTDTPDEDARSRRSGISSEHGGHLRGISDTSVSTDGAGGAYGTPTELPARHEQAVEEPGTATTSSVTKPTVISPLTPPQVIQQGGDYLSAGSLARSHSEAKRTSQFKEKLEED